MIVTQVKSRHDAEQLALELDMIGKQCPQFMDYLERSKNETAVFVAEAGGEPMVKQSGALGDLIRILSDIRDPRGFVRHFDGFET